jgi:hypothetical protein
MCIKSGMQEDDSDVELSKDLTQRVNNSINHASVKQKFQNKKNVIETLLQENDKVSRELEDTK